MAKYYMVGIFFISIPNEINDETICWNEKLDSAAFKYV